MLMDTLKEGGPDNSGGKDWLRRRLWGWKLMRNSDNEDDVADDEPGGLKVDIRQLDAECESSCVNPRILDYESFDFFFSFFCIFHLSEVSTVDDLITVLDLEKEIASSFRSSTEAPKSMLAV